MEDDSVDAEKAMRLKASILQRQIDAAQKELSLILRWLADMNGLKAERLPRPGYGQKRGGKPLPPGISMTWAQAALALLRDQKRPMTPLEMLQFIDQYRSTAGEKKPSWRLSNAMRQKPEDFRRVD